MFNQILKLWRRLRGHPDAVPVDRPTTFATNKPGSVMWFDGYGVRIEPRGVTFSKPPKRDKKPAAHGTETSKPKRRSQKRKSK